MTKSGPGIAEPAHRLMFGRFGALGDDRAMMKREMNIRDLPKPLQYAAVGVLLVLAVVTLLNWFVGLIFGVPLGRNTSIGVMTLPFVAPPSLSKKSHAGISLRNICAC